MKRIPAISALMTPFPWHLEASGTVAQARTLMMRQGIHHLPVTDSEHQVIGLVTLAALPDTPDALVEWMEPVPCVDAHMRADQVLEMMAESHQSVVVIVHHDRLAGIFTWTDVCERFADHLREPFLPPEGNDAA